MNQQSLAKDYETATLGGGCFWCLEAVYVQVVGVRDVVSGYAGGEVANPSYEAVCTGRTGHAEVVQVTFDRTIIGFREILEIFFSIHDPTTLNRQGADVGTQYRSIILYHNEHQKQVAEEMIATLDASDAYRDPIVTQVVPLEAFYAAEDYHQSYYETNTNQPYCRAVIAPKLNKLQKDFVTRLKPRLEV